MKDYKNPTLGSACKINPGQSYCVERNNGRPQQTRTTTITVTSTRTSLTSITASPTSPSNGIATPTPTQPGLVSNCARFDYVKPGDICLTVASRNGISLSDLQKWNTGLGSDCLNLQANVYVCVGIIGQPPVTTTVTTTATGNGIPTPTPTQPGISPNCDRFYKVQPGESCLTIASSNGLSLDQFYSLNTGVGPNCESLWSGTYACVHAFRR
jgi:LysM repeat protein